MAKIIAKCQPLNRQLQYIKTKGKIPIKMCSMMLGERNNRLICECCQKPTIEQAFSAYEKKKNKFNSKADVDQGRE